MTQPGVAAQHGRRRIGFLVDTLTYAYQNELLLGAHERCASEDLDLYCLVGGGLGSAAAADSLYELVGGEAFDGLILSTGTMVRDEPDSVIQAFTRGFEDIPIVSLARAVPGIPSVVIDNATRREVTTHLIEAHGRRRIGIVRVNCAEGDERFEGYKAALNEQGIEFDPALVVVGEFTWEAGQEAVRVLFDERKVGCDALIGANDWIAMGAMDALKRRHLRVGRTFGSAAMTDF